MPGFPRAGLRTHLDWDGIELTVESQGPSKRPDSIQRRVVETMQADGTAWARPDGDGDPWEVIIDDDGANELADVVAMRRTGDTLVVQLVHCKYSSDPEPGHRIRDLYEVCGQAQKSVARRRDLVQLVPHLRRREQNRQKRGITGFETGDANVFYEIDSQLHTLKLQLSIVIVQPGVSAAVATEAHLDLLASTEMYVMEVGGATLDVVVNS